MCDYAAAEVNRLADELAQLKEDYGVVVAVAREREARLEAVEAVLSTMADKAFTLEHGQDTEWRLGVLWAKDRLTDALATTGPSLRERVEELLADWRRLYTVALFPEITEAELARLREIGMLGVIDRNSAAMGRHMADLLNAALKGE